MSSSNVQSIDLPMDCMAWRLWLLRQSNGCSTPAPRSSAAEQWLEVPAQKKKKTTDLSTTVSRNYAYSDDPAITHAVGDCQAVERVLTKLKATVGECLQTWKLKLSTTKSAIVLSKREILMSLNSKEMSLCQLATTELYPKDTKERVIARKWQKRVWVWCRRAVFFSLSNHADTNFVAWWSLTARVKGPFQDSKEFKIYYKVAMFQEKLPTLSIRCIKSEKRRQTNFNEFLDVFFVKKARTKPFNCLLGSVPTYVIRKL